MQIRKNTSIPRLAIPLGDPAGIGTEVVLKALAGSILWQNCQITLIGTERLIKHTYSQLYQQENLKEKDLAKPEQFPLIDLPLEESIIEQISLGNGNAASGEASFRYLETAIALTLSGEFDGIVTAPISKALWKAAGHDYPGQTEVLAQRAGVEKFGMLFVARSPYTGWTLRTLLATTHIPLNQVSQTLTSSLMTRKLDLLIESLDKDFGMKTPQIAIAGLNPHSGEQGQLGTEEKEWLLPWLEAQQQRYPQIQLRGLVPPDTLWVTPGQAWYGQKSLDQPADAYLALYHDQGLIPVKLLAFDQAINTTIGLPFIRTSPDHGTAFAIANSGIAKADSMKAAIQLAGELSQQRKLQEEAGGKVDHCSRGQIGHKIKSGVHRD